MEIKKQRRRPAKLSRKKMKEQYLQKRFVIKIRPQKPNFDKVPQAIYTCPTCNFRTSRVNVFKAHLKRKLGDIYSSYYAEQKKKRRARARPKKSSKVSVENERLPKNKNGKCNNPNQRILRSLNRQRSKSI